MEKEKEQPSNYSNGAASNMLLDDNGSDDDNDDSPSSRLLPDEVRTVSIRQQSRQAVQFLHEMDRDIKSIVTSTKVRLDSLDAVTERLSCRRFFPLESKRANFGADWGIRWWNAVIIMRFRARTAHRLPVLSGNAQLKIR